MSGFYCNYEKSEFYIIIKTHDTFPVRAFSHASKNKRIRNRTALAKNEPSEKESLRINYQYFSN